MAKQTRKAIRAYQMKMGENGRQYVTIESVGDVFHCTDGNSKTGRCGTYNLPIEYTCDHRAPCYKSKACYACNGCYNFPDNQKGYSENFNFFRHHDNETFVQTVVDYITANKLTLFRYFTIGDVPSPRFVTCMNEIAKRCPDVKFWTYTKKYRLVSRWISENGMPAENLVIIFSHWLNDDGTYYPMENPHSLPTSEYIPLGKENLLEGVTHICPCSDPSIVATCATCDHPCYTLKPGESMALLEHSTNRTKARDKAVKAAHDKIKKAVAKIKKAVTKSK